MSKRVDQERAAEAERARLTRAIVLLQELLTIVRARQEGLSLVMIGARIDRSRSTVHDREETLRELLDVVGQRAVRRPRRE